ncbi:MAG: hypothetical protein HY821_10395 [Acidobacteria bacterium]|nr:hypothetical protein [Acidobacteriota bacterium]
MGNASRLHCRIALLTFLAVFVCLAPLAAQSSINVNVSSTLKGATFWVDGKEFTSAASFLWPAGSRHQLEIRSQFQPYGDGRSRLMFTGWTTSSGVSLPNPTAAVQLVTVDSATTSFQASFTVEHKVEVYVGFDPLRNLLDSTAIDLNPISEAELPAKASQYGFVTAAGFGACGSRTGLPTSTWFWMPAGSGLPVAAYPYPGKVFLGWRNPPGPSSSLGQLTVNTPLQLHADFGDARRVYLDSLPAKDMKVLVDSAPVYTRGDKCWPDWSNYYNPITPFPPQQPDYNPTNSTPTNSPLAPGSYCTQIPLCNGNLDLAPGSTHLFAAPSSQLDHNGKLWVFDHWDFGGGQTGGQNTMVTIPTSWTTQTYTAHFVQGIRSSFLTEPTGLKLKIDGRDNWASYNFEWGLGHKHQVSAPAEQVDAKGRRYRFAGWSNGGDADQTVTITDDANSTGSFRMIAKYELLGQLTLRSEPSSLSFNVSGSECRTPCTVDKPAGTEVIIYPVKDYAFSEEAKALFEGWADGSGATERSYAFSSAATTLTARYRYVYKLNAISDPEEGAHWTMEPAPDAGNWFTSGSQVSITATPNKGFKFRRFEGSLTGSYNTGWLTMNAPAAVVARLDRVPALEEGAVRNAAGETPETGVAPGSLISIRGVNMTANYERGPDSPLTQTLGGLAVDVGGRALPLVSVSPTEVLAQLPSDLAEGDANLTIRSATQAALKASFRVVRNAPGLFLESSAPPEARLALARHEAGPLLAADSPAKVGETITLYGTGFGPLEPKPLDGFATPMQPPAPVADSVELLVGGEVRPLIWAGAAPGLVGYTVVRFKVDATMGTGQNLDIQVRVNGVLSNTVKLPVE